MRKVNLLGILVVFICSSLPVMARSVFIVDRLTDTGEGSGLMGDLRYCITNGTSGQDTITFGITGTINLTGALPELHTSVTIAGPGAGQLTVRRDRGDNYRIFTVTGSTTTVVISDLTIANGWTANGGGIYVAGGDLTLSNSILSNNSAWSDGFSGEPGLGGGIYVAGGTVSVDNTTLSNNGAFGSPGYDKWNCSFICHAGGTGGLGLGGGIYVAGGTVSVNNSTLSSNRAVGGNGGAGPALHGGTGGAGEGGGIHVAGGTVNVFQSTLSANQSTGGNGGYPGGDGNNGLGGGLSISGGNVEVEHSTLSTNQSIGGAPDYPGRAGQGRGGGLACNNFTLRTRNTILAGNTAETTARDLSGDLGSLGHNLIGNSTGGSGFDATDLLDVNPRLGALQDNGGPTLTHALLEGSPAMDAGDNTDAPEFDQRGEGCPRIVNNIIDIGAFEVQ